MKVLDNKKVHIGYNALCDLNFNNIEMLALCSSVMVALSLKKCDCKDHSKDFDHVVDTMNDFFEQCHSDLVIARLANK